MVAVLQSNLERIRSLCERHSVRRMYLFGSALRDDFDPTRSDIDFLVEFHDIPRMGFDDEYFKLKFDLEELLGREVDLIELNAIRNPYFLQEVRETRVPIYGA